MGLLNNIIVKSLPYKIWNSIKWATRKVRLHPSTLILGQGQNIKINKGAKIGAGTVLDVSSHGKISIGENCWFYRDIEMRSSGYISIGNGVTLQKGVTLNGNLKIGAGCIFAPNIFMSSGSHIYNFIPSLPIRQQEKIFSLKIEEERLASYDKPISIGEDCWIGINAVVSPGVDIGRGCIVGASSVVTKSVPPYSIVAGVPAKIIGSRLQWLPTNSIDATVVESVPYLYEGFNFSIDEEQLFTHFGSCEKSRVRVALFGDEAETFEIAFESTGSGTVEVDGCEKEFMSGVNTISYATKIIKSEVQCRYFTIIISPLMSGAQLRLLRCRLI